MPPLGPIKRSELIRRLRQLGFLGPYAGGKHEYMVRDKQRISLPNPHRGDIGQHLLARILIQADIARDTWEQLQ